MSQQNNPNPSSSSSLASRLANRLAANQQANNNGSSSQQATPSSPPAPVPPPAPPANQPRSPFGRSNNQNNPPAPSRSKSPFGAQNQRSWAIHPVQKTVVRFDLRGLGDPFYRLLGHALNPDYGDYKTVSAALEKGVEGTRELEAILNRAWESYQMLGATLVYNWNADHWKTVTTPPPVPQPEDIEDDAQQNPPPAPSTFTCVRAIDLHLVLNVLGRSRSQVLLTRAPLVFSQEYLNRSIMSDDPRLVSLAKATGYLEEG